MRPRIKRTTSCIIASSDFNHVKAARETLKAGHEERLHAISMMSFSTKVTGIKKHGRAYVKIWGKKVYIPQDKVQVTEECGMRVYYE